MFSEAKAGLMCIFSRRSDSRIVECFLHRGRMRVPDYRRIHVWSLCMWENCQPDPLPRLVLRVTKNNP